MQVDKTVNIGNLLQALTLAALLYHVNAVRDLMIMTTVHDWRITQLEEEIEK